VLPKAFDRIWLDDQRRLPGKAREGKTPEFKRLTAPPCEPVSARSNPVTPK
jgi:hypothetical protein